MPHYRCPACRVTTHSVGGHFTANTCPNCSAPLAGSDRVYVGQGWPDTISCDLAVEPEAAPAARRALATLQRDPDDAEFETAALLMTELIANSVQHSDTGAGDKIQLDIAVTDDLLRVDVRDEGAGFVPTARTADSPFDSHWGLHLINELAASWGAAPEPPARAWFELSRDASAAAVTPEVVVMSGTQPTFGGADNHVH
jgi:anti-sigma regulatory factor (Ser/Thr protein kinase)